ncbi:uncharacterized protein TNIN_155281 [Trichonephila inaurata madagascariensis]|uniref:Uncharacterized protein n=1 Tax=Trichonephila inaurata madagascariensis TaxID=2747483 RepID=A0A8X6Y6T2_9ARAC|nr:uncharacterized protein TNIN_155281 [Trichonephila inaurata madagascariensis]
MELGDRRPSDLLRQMKSLAGSSISDELIKSLWPQRLPQQLQAILSISKDSLNNIAEMADTIIAVYSSSEVCSVTDNKSSSKSTDRNKLEALQAGIAALTKKFDEFSGNSRQRSKSKEYSREALDPKLIHPDMHFVGIVLSSEIMPRSVYNHSNLKEMLRKTNRPIA